MMITRFPLAALAVLATLSVPSHAFDDCGVVLDLEAPVERAMLENGAAAFVDANLNAKVVALDSRYSSWVEVTFPTPPSRIAASTDDSDAVFGVALLQDATLFSFGTWPAPKLGEDENHTGLEPYSSSNQEQHVPRSAYASSQAVQIPEGLTGVADLASASRIFVALTEDGHAYLFGPDAHEENAFVAGVASLHTNGQSILLHMEDGSLALVHRGGTARFALNDPQERVTQIKIFSDWRGGFLAIIPSNNTALFLPNNVASWFSYPGGDIVDAIMPTEESVVLLSSMNSALTAFKVDIDPTIPLNGIAAIAVLDGLGTGIVQILTTSMHLYFSHAGLRTTGVRSIGPNYYISRDGIAFCDPLRLQGQLRIFGKITNVDRIHRSGDDFLLVHTNGDVSIFVSAERELGAEVEDPRSLYGFDESSWQSVVDRSAEGLNRILLVFNDGSAFYGNNGKIGTNVCVLTDPCIEHVDVNLAGATIVSNTYGFFAVQPDKTAVAFGANRGGDLHVADSGLANVESVQPVNNGYFVRHTNGTTTTAINGCEELTQLDPKPEIELAINAGSALCIALLSNKTIVKVTENQIESVPGVFKQILPVESNPAQYISVDADGRVRLMDTLLLLRTKTLIETAHTSNWYLTLHLRDGSVLAFHRTSKVILDLSSHVFTRIICSVSCLGLTTSGGLFAWGREATLQTFDDRDFLARINTTLSSGVVEMFNKNGVMGALKADGTAVVWQYDESGAHTVKTLAGNAVQIAIEQLWLETFIVLQDGGVIAENNSSFLSASELDLIRSTPVSSLVAGHQWLVILLGEGRALLVGRGARAQQHLVDSATVDRVTTSVGSKSALLSFDDGSGISIGYASSGANRCISGFLQTIAPSASPSARPSQLPTDRPTMSPTASCASARVAHSMIVGVALAALFAGGKF